MSETIILTGNVGTPPETRTTSRGPVTNFRLAVNRRRQDPETGAWMDANTSWFKVAAWRQLGLNASSSIKVGDRVLVVGRVKIDEFRRADGTAGTSVEVDADAIGHDLNFATATATKTAIGARSEQAEAAEARPAPDGRDSHAGSDSGRGPAEWGSPDRESAGGVFGENAEPPF